VHDETQVSGSGAELSWESAAAALDTAVHEYLGPYTAEEVVAKFRGIHPDYSPAQVDTAAATAFRAWPGQRWEAERRAASAVSQRHTWVYQMNFTGASGRAVHTIDIPFMFDNVAMAEGLIGSAPEHLAAANALAETMSQTLITYARTGDPNEEKKLGARDGALPCWPTYDLRDRSTMVWDHMPRVEKDPRGAERLFAERAHYHQAGTPLP